MTNVPLNTNQINRKLRHTQIAIVGMGSIFPQAQNLQEYWENIVQKVDCITDVPPSRWNIDDYYDANPRTPDKTYCKRGGFIPDVDFNPMEFGLPPDILEVTDISQLLGLLVAKSAIEDAGYGDFRQFNRDIYDRLRQRTGVVLGVEISRQLAIPLSSRLQYPVWEKVLKSSGLSDEDTQSIVEKIKSAYVEWNENAFPGMLANVISGRIANFLDLGGMNCVVDAACASSLGALKIAISELVEHRSDMMLTGGVDTDNSILAYMCFSKTPAVSPSENVKPFDADSDGMMLGEGVGMLVLKRLEDAERDNDRIYAVIKGIGSSSDGRYKSIYAPRSEGQITALHRAYEDADCSPTSVGLIEAHGTGTMAGDPTEFSSIKTVFSENNPKQQYIALGSVKSQIGHTKAAAGAASLIKTALALHHKVLPPTINITQPHPKLNIENSPFYLNTETRPWITRNDQPRRAGVSAFGFGGTNYHVVLEEYKHEHNQPYRIHNIAESVLISAKTPEHLLSRCEEIQEQLQSDGRERHYAELIAAVQALEIPITDARVGFVANSLTQAGELLQKSIDLLKNKLEAESWEHPQGIYYRKTGISKDQKVVALFSGQGSQYLEMGRELVINFPCLRQTYAEMDRLLSQDGLQPVSEVVFPHPVFNPESKAAQMSVLQLTEYAQPAIGAFSAGLYKILQQAGFKADMVAGHSFGELTALWVAGVLSEEDYYFLVKARGQAMATPPNSQLDHGTMLAVKGDVSQVKKLIENFPLVHIANLNSHQQMVLAGTKAEIAKVEEMLTAQGFYTGLLTVSAAFHTSLVAYAVKPFANAIERVTLQQPQIPVYTNFTGTPYPNQPKVIQNILQEHLGSQVLFQEEIENIYAEGGYCFVEFGPRNTLTNLVREILGARSHIAVALNTHPQKDSDRTLREAVVQLRVAGLPLFNLDPYKQSRPIPPEPQTQLLNVRLNSTNYVSDKTKQLFEKALQNGHQAQLPVSNGHYSTISNSVTAENLHNRAIPTETVAVNGQPKLPTEELTVHEAKSMKNGQSDQQDIKSTPNNLEATVNYQRAIDNLEYTLIEFNRHQRHILQVHEQSLKHQTEYTKTFFGLMQQQHILWGNGKFIQQEPQTQQLAISSSERSIMRFHQHQADSLRIHEQYLNYQQEYTHNFFQLVQQHQLPTCDDTTEHSLIPSFQYQDSSRIPTYSEYQPISVTTASAVATKPEPVSNGNGNGNGNGAHHQPTPVLDIIAPQENQTLVAAPPVEIDAATLSQTLLTIVSDKTGYPSEMLEMSMDIEADLGIDSIKRVEILGALLELYPDLPQPNSEEIAPLRTLQEIVDYIEQTVEEAGAQGTGSKGEGVGNSLSSQSHSLIRRSPARLKFLPEPDFLNFTLPAQHIALLTDDGSLTTTKLAEALSKRGWKTVVLSFPQTLIGKQSPLPDSINRVVLSDLSEEHLQQQLNAIASEYGKVAAFIHLNPPSLQNSSNHVCYLETEKSLLRHVFLTAKYLKESLNQAAEQGRSCFLTVARLDGEFGLGQKTNFGAISSGLFGLTKTVNQEWEPVFCRALDISPDLDAQTSVEHILAELHDHNRLVVEVGYTAQGRTTLICEPKSDDIFANPIPHPQSQVFLVSGGAKGITAKCVIELAQRYQCRFILLGRSAAEPKPVWAEGYVGEMELKKRIMEGFIAKGDKPTPAMVQKKFQTIASRREIAATLQAIKQAGGQAEYLSVDVTDAVMLSEKVASAVERLGPVTGIIHAAGNLADKRIEKKTLQDFETVYAAKVKGLENLLRCIPNRELQYLVLFSSVVGFYGNVGQSDYAIANEILNKSAHLFKRNHPNCHVVAINWGPWDSGMVSPELKKAFSERNIETIPLEIGAQMLINELEQKNNQSTQVVIGSPLIYIPEALNPELKSFRIQRRLTLAANPFLRDHVIAGKPVLPATCAIAWIANTCEQLYPGYKFFSCQKFKILKGIIFDGNQAPEYTLDLVEISKSDVNEIEVQAKIWSKNGDKIRHHFSANIKLQKQITLAPIYEPFNQERANPDISTSFYQNGASSLFHGSAFQGVKRVLNITPETITIECLLPQIPETQQGQFPVQTFNPYIADVQVHSLWIWSQHFHQLGCLPSEIHNFEQFADLPFGKKLYISCQVKSKTESAVVADVITHDIHGKIYSRMMGARGIILPKSAGKI
ncbi:SDR family NAD(P)-dependent oxidoreductase [Anabaena sp. CCY 0017]|uniref:SDR family NAD(P)-dependent oxidoreductase n=1 Tax=Anabaena sp. CCY 0017 TaxID=3103866 RepID=UPI0039C619A6